MSNIFASVLDLVFPTWKKLQDSFKSKPAWREFVAAKNKKKMFWDWLFGAEQQHLRDAA